MDPALTPDSKLSKNINGRSDQKKEDRKIYCIPADQGYGNGLPFYEIAARILYRIIEIAVSIVALIVTLPIMIAVAVIIKLDSPGPALFFQERCSRSRKVKGSEIADSDLFSVGTAHFDPDSLYWKPKTFKFVKFRTMYDDARERFPDLYDYRYTPEQIETITYKSENDPRVTKAGKWLRKSTLDELPNLWNVITGDIRLVGPRPEVFEMLPNYKEDQLRKFTVKAGITGLSQINGRGNISIQQHLQYDLEYIEKKSVFLDIKILFITFWKVITSYGAF